MGGVGGGSWRRQSLVETEGVGGCGGGGEGLYTGENPLLSAPTETLPYHYYQDEGLYTVPHSLTLNLQSPSTAENQSLPSQLSPSHHPLIVTGENPSLSAPTVTLPYHHYQEDGLYTVTHSPTLKLLPLSTAEIS
ncbi:hypothetical protein Fot_47369 [Forsythia ovata]|uniref:Uncharacterized protein n=1 Tax=Forsythia ovata TaxID=205694 RepID=A0ABD1QQ67_9LAMI